MELEGSLFTYSME